MPVILFNFRNKYRERIGEIDNGIVIKWFWVVERDQTLEFLE